MKINEQIAALRKKKGVTQENLAQVLGVTNQSVSKWESGQCCPDIQLLPAIAKYFEVSIDELMGEETPATRHEEENLIKNQSEINDPLLDGTVELLGEQRLITTAVLQRKMGIGYTKAKELIEEMQARGEIVEVRPGFYRRTQSQQEFLWTMVKAAVSKGRDDILNTALAMHAAWFYKSQKAESSIDRAVEAVIGGRWGYSAISEPDATMVMRGQSVFYSKNTGLDLNPERIGRIGILMKVLSKRENLTVFAALYELTVHDEQLYIDMETIAAKSTLSVQAVSDCLEESLFPYVMQKDQKYRIKGEEMSIIPILSILCY